MNAQEILQEATNSSFAIWFLIGAGLVFFMQAGFAMVETGFTRAKNAGNNYYEEPDGLLYWYINVHYFRIWFDDVRRLRNGSNWYSKILTSLQITTVLTGHSSYFS